jgi:hypothetical protein
MFETTDLAAPKLLLSALRLLELLNCLLYIINSDFCVLIPSCYNRTAMHRPDSVDCSAMRNCFESNNRFFDSLGLLVRVHVRVDLVLLICFVHFSPLHDIELVLTLFISLTACYHIDGQRELIVLVLLSVIFIYYCVIRV